MKKIFLLIFLSAFITSIEAQKFSVLKDIKPGVSSSNPSELITGGNKLFFVATDSAHGQEIWFSEGTEATTQLLIDLKPGVGGSNPQRLIYFNGYLYFTADNNFKGQELWKLDVSTLEAEKLTDATLSTPFYGGFTPYNNCLYFTFDDNIHGNEVWKTDGTIAGTKMVVDVWPDFTPTPPTNYFVFHSKLFFYGTDVSNTIALYAIDSVDAVTKIFNGGSRFESPLTLFKDALYFVCDDQDPSQINTEIYTSDGTTTGTHLLKEINPFGSATSSGLLVSGDEFFFNANDGVHGFELWKSDGTEEGTQMVRDLYPGIKNSNSYPYYAYHNKVILSVEPEGQQSTTWISDGTAAGTKLLSDTIQIAGSPGVIANDKLLFEGISPHAYLELFMTNGAKAGTRLLLDIYPGETPSEISSFTIMDTSLFFIARTKGKGTEVYYITPLDLAYPLNNKTAVTMIEKEEMMLKQNAPNPFGISTTIEYTLPVSYKKAELVFSTQGGTIVKRVPLSGSGKNKLQLSNSFYPGTYFYSLLINGKVVSTKKCMVIY